MSAPLTSPENILLNFIKEAWTLNLDGVKNTDCVFTDKDVATDAQVYAPHIVVMQAGTRRLQPAENTLYEFSFIVKVSLWSRWHKLSPNSDKRLLHWAMVSHIKQMFDVASPAVWQYGYVDSTANIALAMNLLPELNEFNLAVKAGIHWRGI